MVRSLIETQIWAKKRFRGSLISPESASCNQAMPQSSIYIRLEIIHETRRLKLLRNRTLAGKHTKMASFQRRFAIDSGI